MELKAHELRFLRSHVTAELATIGAGNAYPHVTPIFYVCDHKGNLYFVAKNSSRKLANIKNNPHVGISITDQPDLTTVRITGDATVCPDDSADTEILDYLSARSVTASGLNFPPVVQQEKGPVSLIRVQIRTITLLSYSSQAKPASNVQSSPII